MARIQNTLKKLRLHKGKTQQELAEVLGLDRTTIVKYETTKTMPSPEILIKIAEYFNVSSDYLLGLSENETNLHAENLKREILALHRAELTEEELKEILAYAKFRFPEKF